MSGGSWSYIYRDIDEAAENLLDSKCTRRQRLGRLMHKIADAMHDIEWVDSCDYAKGDEFAAIERVFMEGH